MKFEGLWQRCKLLVFIVFWGLILEWIRLVRPPSLLDSIKNSPQFQTLNKHMNSHDEERADG